jgi:hypothetical protein
LAELGTRANPALPHSGSRSHLPGSGHSLRAVSYGNANSPGFTFGGELSESRTTPARIQIEEDDDKN